MLTTILVDDEEDSRNALRNFLTRYCPDVSILAEAASVADAQGLIVTHRPGLVFLDVNMPHKNGFALFQEIPLPDFQTIFVTAYDAYALQAIKHRALDYIMKPLNITELVQAVARAKQVHDERRIVRGFDGLLSAAQPAVPPAKIGLPASNGFIYVPAADIVHCEAEGSYTLFHFNVRKPILVCRTLGFYEERLKDLGFIRVHHRYLVNLAHVERYQRGRGGIIVMSNGQEVIVSQRKRDIFLEAIDGDTTP